MKTITYALSMILIAAVVTGCANRSCSDWPGTCIIQ